MKDFLKWRKGYIDGNKYLGFKPKGIVYQICRYYIQNNTHKWWKIWDYLFFLKMEKNKELFEELQKLRK